jgi:hypothetical protein
MPVWKPKALSDFEVGKACSAIEDIARRGRAYTETKSARYCTRADVEYDLAKCIELHDTSGTVHFWSRDNHKHVKYGFYSQPWVPEAINFLETAELSRVDRAWIKGLLCGFTSQDIQKDVAKAKA